jgi:hypothetical protein
LGRYRPSYSGFAACSCSAIAVPTHRPSTSTRRQRRCGRACRRSWTRTLHCLRSIHHTRGHSWYGTTDAAALCSPRCRSPTRTLTRRHHSLALHKHTHPHTTCMHTPLADTRQAQTRTRACDIEPAPSRTHPGYLPAPLTLLPACALTFLVMPQSHCLRREMERSLSPRRSSAHCDLCCCACCVCVWVGVTWTTLSRAAHSTVHGAAACRVLGQQRYHRATAGTRRPHLRVRRERCVCAHWRRLEWESMRPPRCHVLHQRIPLPHSSLPLSLSLPISLPISLPHALTPSFSLTRTHIDRLASAPASH